MAPMKCAITRASLRSASRASARPSGTAPLKLPSRIDKGVRSPKICNAHKKRTVILKFSAAKQAALQKLLENPVPMPSGRDPARFSAHRLTPSPSESSVKLETKKLAPALDELRFSLRLKIACREYVPKPIVNSAIEQLQLLSRSAIDPAVKPLDADKKRYRALSLDTWTLQPYTTACEAQQHCGHRDWIDAGNGIRVLVQDSTQWRLFACGFEQGQKRHIQRWWVTRRTKGLVSCWSPDVVRAQEKKEMVALKEKVGLPADTKSRSPLALVVHGAIRRMAKIDTDAVDRA